MALQKLGKSKGYVLVGCESRGINAFFVREDLIDGNFLVRDIKDIYVPPGYGNGGHPSSVKMLEQDSWEVFS